MDIKRSNRIKKAAAIAALVLVVGSASVAAEVGNGGLFGGDVVNAEGENGSLVDAIENGSVEIKTVEIKNEKDLLEKFINADVESGKILVGKLMDSFQVEGGYAKLDSNKVLFGNGNTLTLKNTTTHHDAETVIASKLELNPTWHMVPEKERHTDDEGDMIKDDDGGLLVQETFTRTVQYEEWEGYGKNRHKVVKEKEEEYTEWGYYSYDFKEETDENGISVPSYDERKPLFYEICSGAVVENLELNAPNGIYSCKNSVGALCNVNYGEIEYVTVAANVTSAGNAVDGTGIICGVNNGRIEGCIAEGVVAGTSNYIGSICGKNYGDIKYCKSSAYINFGTESQIVGGLCGFNRSTIFDCFFEGFLRDYRTDSYSIEAHNNAKNNYRIRLIGGVCGVLEGDKSYVRNSLYLSETRIKRKENAKYTNSGFDCVGLRNTTLGNLLNLFRYNTYYGNHTSNHYHENKFPDYGRPYDETEYSNGNVVITLNNNREDQPWKQGAKLPELRLAKKTIQYIKPKAVTVEYDKNPHVLVTPGVIKSGRAVFEYSYDNKTWYVLEKLPQKTEVGDYKIYYRINNLCSYELDIVYNTEEHFFTSHIVKKVASPVEAPSDVTVPYGTKLSEVTLDKEGWTITDKGADKIYPTVDGYTATVQYKVTDDDLLDYTGVDGYKDGVITKTIKVTATPKDIQLSANDLDYTGNALDPKVSYDKKDLVANDKDIDIKNITYKKNGNTVTEVKDAGDYTASAVTPNKNYKLIDAKFKVNTVAATVNVKANNFKYDGKKNPLVTVDLNGVKKITYTVEKDEKPFLFKTNDDGIPVATDAGSYVVHCTVELDDNHTYAKKKFDVPVTVEKRILKVDWTDKSELEELTYTGSPLYPAYTIGGDGYAEGTLDNLNYTIELEVSGEKTPVSVGDYEITPKLVKKPANLPDNYELDAEAKKYNITKAGLSVVSENVSIEMPYGEATIAAVQAKFAEKLKGDEYFGSSYGDYEFEEFTVDGITNESELVDVGNYTKVIHYYVKDADGTVNAEGILTETLDVTPIAVTVDVDEKTGLVFNGGSQTLATITATGADKIGYTITEIDVNGKTVSNHDYVSNGNSATPKGTNAGTYKISYTVVPDKNHTTPLSGEIEVPIAQSPTASVEIAANYGVNGEKLVYDGTEQELVKVTKSVNTASVTYKVTTAEDENNVLYSGNEIPTAKDAGSYKVICTVTAADNYTFTDENGRQSDTKTVTVPVTISPRDIKVTWPSKNTFRFDEEIKFEGTTDGILACDNNTEVKTTLPKIDKVGTYTAVADVEDANYNITEGKTADLTITDGEAEISIEAAYAVGAESLVYNGEDQKLVEVKTTANVAGVTYTVSKAEDAAFTLDSESNIPAARNAGHYTVVCTVTAADNYTFTNADGSQSKTKTVTVPVTIDPRNIVVTWPSKNTFRFDEEIKFEGTTDGILTCDNNTEVKTTLPKIDKVGTYTAVADVEDANYNITEGKTADLTITDGEAEVSIEAAYAVGAESLVYNGEAQKLVEVKTSSNVGSVTYKVTQSEGENATVVSEVGTDIPTATNAGTYTVVCTVTAADNYTFTENGKQSKTKTVTVPVTIAPRDIAVDWTGSQKNFTYGEEITYGEEGKIKAKFVGIDGEVGIVAKDEKLESVKPAYRGLDKKNVGTGYEASVTIADPNYNIKSGNPFHYNIIAKTANEIVNAIAGEYTGADQELVSVKPVDGLTVEFVSVKKDNADFELKTENGVPVAKDAGSYDVTYKATADGNHSLTDAEGNVLKDENGREIKSKEVTVSAAITKAELTVNWTEGEEFTFDPALKEGEYQVPSIESVTGYKTDADKTDYKLTVIPAEGSDGRSASDHQKAVVVFERSKTAESDNYYFEIEEKEYKIAKNTFEDLADKIEDITAEVVYGESSSTIEAAKTALEAKLVENLGENYDNKYKFAPESFEFKDINGDLLDDSKVLNVAEYTGEIKYTLNSDGQADTNYEGTFKWTLNVKEAAATIDISPYSGEYDAESHPVAEVKSENCKVRYSITVDGVDHISYSVPTVADAGEYVIGYTVEVDGNHKLPVDEKGNVITSGTITATITQKDVSFKWNGKPEYTYNDGIEITAEAVGICDKDKDKVSVVVDVPAKKGSPVNDYKATAALADSEEYASSETFTSVLGNYNVTDEGFNFKIVKATPSIKLEDKYTATYGDKLSTLNDKLPQNDPNGTYSWKYPNKEVGNVGDENKHTVVYTPKDDKNNNIVETEVTVDVLPKEVHLIWNIENGAEFTYDGSSQDVSSYPDLNDVFDRDEKAFEVTVTADDFVNAGSHKANAAINDTNYVIAAGDESRTFGILKNGELQPMNYSETYEYGTTAKEIFDDLFAKHFGDFSAFAKQYSVDPESVEVYKNGKKIETEKLKNYAKSCLKAQDLIFDGDIVDQLNSLGRSFYNKPDFNVLNNYNDYMQVKTLVDTNRDRIKSFINAGVLPEADKYRKLVTLFEKYEAVKEAENVMQEVGDYKITVNYNHMADEKEQSLTRFLKLSNNYHPAALTAEVKITPCVITGVYADIDSKTYDTTTDVNVNGFTFFSEKNGGNKSWNIDGYDKKDCQFVSADAGTTKINAEITLTDGNFCFGYDHSTGKPVMTGRFYDVDTDGIINKAVWPFTLNLKGFEGELLSTISAPDVLHGTFKWNNTKTVISEGANVIDESEYTFTPDAKDNFNKNYDVKLTVNVNGVKKPVETVVETAVETVIVTEETKPSVTEATGKPVTTAETSANVSEAQTTPAGTETTSEGTTAVTTTVTESKAETTASTSGAVTTTVTETTGVTKADTTDLPEITVPASTTAKLMGEVTDAPVIVTKPVTSADTKAVTTAAVTTAKTEVTKAAETTAATTAKTEETKPVTTAVTTGKVTSAETTVSTAAVTTTAKADVTTANVTTAKVTEATTAGVTTVVTTAGTTSVSTTETTTAATTAKVTEATTAGVTTVVTTAGTTSVSTAETTKAAATAKVTEATTAGVTTPVTTAGTTAATTVTTPVSTAETTTVTTAGVTTAEVTAAETTVAETTAVTEPKATEAETTAATTTVTEATAAETTSEVTEAEVTPAATLPTLPDITLPEVTTDKLMGDVTEAEVTTSEDVTTAAVTTPAVTEETKTDLDKIREIIINEPEKVNKEVREDDKISIDGEEIKLSLEDKMFFQGTESFDYPVRLKDFNAEKAYFDYAGFGFELPAGFTVDPESLSTDLKGNIKYYAPDSIEALSLVLKTGYTANGGYVVFRGVETRNLAPDAVLFTVKVKAADTLNVCVSRIGVSALYGRLTENSKFAEDGKVEPHVAFIDNGAGEQLYTKADSSVRMGIKGDVNLDGKVSQVDATIILREILSLEVAKESLLADNINVHEGTAAEAVELSHFLGNVNQSPNGLFTQIDATSILRGILERDINNTGIVTEEIWKKVTNK